MERRALLAFVASMLLFLAYDAFYLSPRNEQARRQRAELTEQANDSTRISLEATGPTGSDRTAISPESAQMETDTRSSEAIRDDEGTRDTQSGKTPTVPAGLEVPGESAIVFRVVSELYEFEFSSAGGELVSVRLPAYRSGDGPVELIPQDPSWRSRRPLNVSLVSTAATVDLSVVGFSATGPNGAPISNGATVIVDPGRESTEITFRAGEGAAAIERYYRFYPDRYDFDAGIRFAAAGYQEVSDVAWGLGAGLRPTEHNVKDDLGNFKASVQLGEEVHRLKPSHFGDKAAETFSGTLSWAAIQTKYFTAIVMPPSPVRGRADVLGSKSAQRITQRITLPAIAERGQIDQSVRLYFGPLDLGLLKKLGAGLEKNIEMGWRLVRPVSWLVLWAMKWLHHFIPNYGLVIVIISVLTKVLFFRLTHKSFKSMKDLQALQPRLQALKEKHKKDKQRLSQETMKLYKEAGVNPLGGCLPMVLQMPVFIALFNVLKYTIEVRGAYFVGWINDLSQQDVLFKLPISLPLIGNDFSLLPLLMGGAMFLQTKIGGSITPGSPNSATPPGFQTMMPIVFTFLFYKMPSGLVIYWFINTVMSVAQQYYINKDGKEKSDAAISSVGNHGGTSKGR